MSSFKSFLTESIVAILLFIPLSALTTALILFFTNIILKLSWNFMAIWKSSYLNLTIIFVAGFFIQTAYSYIVIIWLGVKLKRPFNKIGKGLFVFKMHELKPVREWTPEWFDQVSNTKEAVESLGNKIAKALEDRYYNRN